ncbi:MAG: DUF1905 domain-containing protein [Saprospiraceae bacterium]|nr:DUF1905 domain-containing protein [Saprospiraceae bacterium]
MSESLEFQSIMEESGNRLWGFHLPVPDMVVQMFSNDNERRVVCTLNNDVTYQCALLPKGEGRYCIVVNKKIRDKMGLKAGSVVQVSIRKDESEFGLPMPEELAELLKQDEEGHKWFHNLTPGKLRTLLYIVGQPKTSEKRLQRAITIVEHLKRQQGEIDYKQLNIDMKSPR